MLKCLGAPARPIFALYLSLILLLALVGVAIGISGVAAPFVAAGPLAANFALDLAPALYPQPLLLAAGFGLLTALAFSLPALMRRRDLPPGQLFRDMLESRGGGWRRRLREARGWGDLLLMAAVIAALIGLAFASAGDPLFAAWFVAGALATLIVFRLLAAAVRAARGGSPAAGAACCAGRSPISPARRAPTGSVMLALGIGLTVLVGVAMVQGNLRQELEQAMPARAPSFYLHRHPARPGRRLRQAGAERAGGERSGARADAARAHHAHERRAGGAAPRPARDGLGDAGRSRPHLGRGLAQGQPARRGILVAGGLQGPAADLSRCRRRRGIRPQARRQHHRQCPGARDHRPHRQPAPPGLGDA